VKVRVSLGFDIHRFSEGRKLVLCGVEVPYELGLLGHSDADVGLHAVIDAMLSAAGLPDIGSTFPDTDPKYEGISSLKLLEKAKKLVEERGFKVSQVDITFVCDSPKLSKFYPKMKETLAKALNLDLEDVGIKARTTEGLWEKNKGIACFALVTLLKQK